MDKRALIADMDFMRGKCDPRMAKYRRSFNRYTTNGNRRDDLRTPYQSPLAYYYASGDEDLGPIPIINLIRSVIDTKVSKLSQTKVRPFFNPVNGLYHTRKVTRQAQQFFDEYYEQKKVYDLAMKCRLDAEIFEIGWAWVRDDKKCIERVRPWEVYFDPAEVQFGRMTRCFVDLSYYPAAYILEELKGSKAAIALETLQKYATDPGAKIRLAYYYDLEGKREYMVSAGEIIREREIEYQRPPFVPLWCNDPIKGGQSVSTADNLYTVQSQLDMVVEKTAAAFELSPAMSIFVPMDVTGNPEVVKPSNVDNRVGNVFGVPPSASGAPMTVATPRPIDPMYIEYAKYLIETAYNMEGISQLSAQSKKPSGITAGVALETLENVESDRHNVPLLNQIKFYMDIAEAMIDIFPDSNDILPNKIGRGKPIKWSEIRKSREEFSIQFTATSSLSKDPETKMKQIEKLLQLGVLKPGLAAELLELPDLEQAFTVMTTSYDACQRIIEQAIEENDMDFEPIVSLDQLFQETMQMYLRLYANDEKKEYLERCKRLLEVINAKQDEIVQQTTPPPPPAPPAPPVEPVPPEGMPMQGPAPGGVPAPEIPMM